MKKKAENMTIDEGFDNLTEILGKMDMEGVSLEESFKLYNEGLLIVKELNEKLVEAENRITIVNEGE